MSNTNTTIYLAGHISGLTYDQCNEWREEATAFLTALDYSVRSPMREKEILKQHYEDNPLPSQDYGVDNPFTENPFPRDMFDIAQSDIILVNLVPGEEAGIGVSLGTAVEIGVAHNAGKYIIVVSGEKSLHPFVREPAAYIVTRLEDAFAILEATQPMDAPQLIIHRYEPIVADVDEEIIKLIGAPDATS